MKNFIRLMSAVVVTVFMVSCESDDSNFTEDLQKLEAPENLGATFKVTQDNSGLVTILPTGEGATLFSVDFGDGSAESDQLRPGEEVQHVYGEGTYEVLITGTGLNGKTAVGTQELVVSFLPPENLEVTVTKDPDDNYSISVSATADFAAMFEVYFGDEEDEEPTPLMIGESVSHTYQEVGTYNIKVVALSGGQATTEVTQEVKISDPLFLPIDFESPTLNYTFINFGGGEGAGVEIVENPDPDEVNSSATVASYTKVPNSETWAGTTIALDEPIDFSSERYVSVDVWSPIAGADVIFKVENLADAGIAAEYTATTTVSNQWETLTFDLNSIDPNQEYGRIVLFFNFNIPGTGETYYFDNIKTTRLENIELPLTFESETLEFNWAGFGGAAGSVINNPEISEGNTSDKVTELTKSEGAQTWAGISLNLDEPVDFSAGTLAKMTVWSPEAGIPVLFKLEDSQSVPDANGNPSVFVEVQSTTTTSGQWEELSFDLSESPSFDPGVQYDRVIVFYDFGNPGGGDSFYLDDIRITSEDEPTSVVLPVTFENPSLNYELTAFEGAESAIESNPFQQGINTSSTVVRTTKTEGARFYAGTTLQLEEPIDFSNQEKISVKVFSPKAGIPVRMKLENNNDPGIFLEVDATTSVENQWEELIFDFSGLETSLDYSKIILFFEFVPDLPGDGTTYYYDDIQLIN